MLLSRLNPEQQQALLVLARRVVEADHRLTMQEVEALEGRLQESVLDSEPTYRDVADLPLMFPERSAQIALLLELLMIGSTDGHLADAELAEVRCAADAFQLDYAEWERIVDWSRRYRALFLEIDTL
ncbi:hypothetical protein BH23BAC4_BH23BAC4_06500 [soil metagenome]